MPLIGGDDRCASGPREPIRQVAVLGAMQSSAAGLLGGSAGRTGLRRAWEGPRPLCGACGAPRGEIPEETGEALLPLEQRLKIYA